MLPESLLPRVLIEIFMSALVIGDLAICSRSGSQN